MDPCAKSKARQAARSSAGGTSKDSRQSAPLLKHVEEHVSSTPHPPVLARGHAHQYNQSQKHLSHTVAQPTPQQPLAANTMHHGVHNSAGRVSYHGAPQPLSKHVEEHVSSAPHSPMPVRGHAHQYNQSQKHLPHTVAQPTPQQPLAANTMHHGVHNSAGRVSYHGAPQPLLKHVEEHVSLAPHSPVLVRGHAHQYNQNHLPHTVAQPTPQQPLAANTMHHGVHNSAGRESYHGAPQPLSKHVEEPVSRTFHPPVLAKVHAHQLIQSQKYGSDTVAKSKGQPANPPASNTAYLPRHK